MALRIGLGGSEASEYSSTDEIEKMLFSFNQSSLKGRPGKYSTVTEHMPEDHQKYLEYSLKK